MEVAPVVEEEAAVHFDGVPHVVVRPVDVPDAVDAARSEAVRLPEGEPVALSRRWMREEAITHDIFSAGPFRPYQDVYLSERFVRTARDAGLTGTARFELAWADDRPCGPPYPPTEVTDCQLPAMELVYKLLVARAELHAWHAGAARACATELAKAGWIGLGAEKPRES